MLSLHQEVFSIFLIRLLQEVEDFSPIAVPLCLAELLFSSFSQRLQQQLVHPQFSQEAAFLEQVQLAKVHYLEVDHFFLNKVHKGGFLDKMPVGHYSVMQHLFLGDKMPSRRVPKRAKVMKMKMMVKETKILNKRMMSLLLLPLKIRQRLLYQESLISQQS